MDDLRQEWIQYCYDKGNKEMPTYGEWLEVRRKGMVGSSKPSGGEAADDSGDDNKADDNRGGVKLGKYAVLYNDQTRDVQRQPICLLFEAESAEQARLLGVKVLLEEEDDYPYIGPEISLIRLENMRVVQLTEIGPIRDNSEYLDVARHEIEEKHRVERELHQKQQAAQDEANDRRAYARLKERFEKDRKNEPSQHVQSLASNDARRAEAKKSEFVNDHDVVDYDGIEEEYGQK